MAERNGGLNLKKQSLWIRLHDGLFVLKSLILCDVCIQSLVL